MHKCFCNVQISDMLNFIHELFTIHPTVFDSLTLPVLTEKKSFFCYTNTILFTAANDKSKCLNIILNKKLQFLI